MAELKWIKIFTDIFDDEKILLIENMANNDTTIVCWFKLLCLAGKQNNSGVFLINERIPYTDEMLATIFRRPLDIVKSALQTFENLGMIEVVNNTIIIPKWEKHQNIDEMERIKEQNRQRVAKHREKQKQLSECNVTVTLPVTQCNATDKNRLDKNRLDKNNITFSNEKVCQAETARPDVEPVVNAWNSLSEDTAIKPISKISCNSTRYKMLTARLKEYGIDDVLKAIENIRQSDFLKGNNDRGWIITFDWFVKPNNFPKVLEGNYNHSVETAGLNTQTKKPTATDEFMAKLAAIRERSINNGN